jgi:hypothetical protein
MIKMFIAKNEEGHIMMGKQIGQSATKPRLLILEDVVKVAFMQTGQGIAPVPCYYPNMMAKDIVKKSFLNKVNVDIFEDDYLVIDVDDIVPEMVQLYQMEMKSRNGVPKIDVVGSVPPNLKLVR